MSASPDPERKIHSPAIPPPLPTGIEVRGPVPWIVKAFAITILVLTGLPLLASPLLLPVGVILFKGILAIWELFWIFWVLGSPPPLGVVFLWGGWVCLAVAAVLYPVAYALCLVGVVRQMRRGTSPSFFALVILAYFLIMVLMTVVIVFLT